MREIKYLFYVLCIIVLTNVCGCDDESDTDPVAENNAPTVANAIGDLALDEGFGTEDVDLSSVFSDADEDNLTLTISSSEVSVVTVSGSGSTLTLTEVGTGSSVISVTADDGNEGSVTDNFNVAVSIASSTCSLDNSTQTSLNSCGNSHNDDSLTPFYSENVSGDVRTIMTNNVPDHSYGSPVDKIAALSTVTYSMDATPEKAANMTTLLGAERIDFEFGVGLNGVKFDPEANFPFENSSTGEMNYGWMLEATNNTATTTLDCNQAHLQATGAYHYHGDFAGYADELGIDGSAMKQVGWAADGFPIYYKYGYTSANDNTSAVKELKSSYQVQSGERPGDGLSAPCGTYNGRYEQDYEYSADIGDLDECNGRTGVTPEFPAGTYYYVITADYPLIPRCFSGTPDNSFRIGGGG